MAGRQHRDRRIVCVDHVGLHDMRPNHRGERRDPPGSMADPIGKGSAFDLDALARQDRRLTVER